MSVLFVTGFLVGLSVAAPIGPMGLLCMHRTLDQGLYAGLSTGMGAATVHFAYGAIAAVGFGATAATSGGPHAVVLPLAGALALFWFALRLVRNEQVTAPRRAASGRGMLGCYLSAVSLGALNPATIILFTASSQAVAGTHDVEALVLMSSGVFSGSALWWVVFSILIASCRDTIGARVRRMISRTSAAILMIMGSIIVARAAGAL